MLPMTVDTSVATSPSWAGTIIVLLVLASCQTELPTALQHVINRIAATWFDNAEATSRMPDAVASAMRRISWRALSLVNLLKFSASTS